MPRMTVRTGARDAQRTALKSVPIIRSPPRTAEQAPQPRAGTGVNVYLGKPYQNSQLLDSIAEQLGQETGSGAAGINSVLRVKKRALRRPFFRPRA